ncbi:MAG: helix-turn-helix domain-containing protein [Coriobacteriia bacterium]|nr:helix-turn-helix domain-containing protein [Coriobacteriia bacterium]
MPTTAEKQLLTVAEVADLFRVTERTVRAWTAAGTLRAVRIGARVRYRRATLEALLDDLEGGPS